MSAAIDNGVDNTNTDQQSTKSNVVPLCASPIVRKLRRDPSYYPELLKQLCRATQEM